MSANIPTTDRPLRILRIVSSLRPECGGPSESIIRSSEALLKLGHQVEVATADAPASLPPFGVRFPLHALGGYDAGTLGLWLRANHARFDAVIVHGLWQAGWTVNRVLRRKRTPYLVLPHGMLDSWFRRAYPFKHLKKQLYWWLREGRVLREAAAVCFTCEEECRLARGTFFPYRVHERVISYGTADPQADAGQCRARFAAQFPALPRRPFLLFLGRLHDKKGLRELITAHAALRHHHPDSPALAIAGPCADPDFVRELRQLASNAGVTQLDLTTQLEAEDPRAALFWLPMLGDDLKWGALLNCEAFILPSHQENFGIAVAEALACGRPVLISHKVNIWREISADGAGLVAPNTEAGVKDLILGWNRLEPAARTAMAAAARRCFLKRFEIREAALSLAAVAAECVPAAIPSLD